MNPADLTWDPAAEQSVLGSILLSPACLPTVERSLRPADFRLASDRAVYEAVLSLERAGGSVDPVTVLDQTAKMGASVSREYLFGLMELAATAANVEEHVRIVQEDVLRSGLMELAETVHSRVTNRTPVAEALAQARQTLDKLERQGSAGRLATPTDILTAFYRQREAVESGDGKAYVCTGYMALDSLLGGGLINSGLYLLAARPGMGKTTLALNIADRVAKADPVLFISLEMDSDQLAAKRISRLTGIPSERLLMQPLTDAEAAQTAQAASQLSTLPLYSNEAPTMTVDDIGTLARSIGGLRLVVVDYFGKIAPPAELRRAGRYEYTTEISGALKNLARALKIPVLVLCQLNRELESRQDKHPQLSDLRDTGALEQDADGVIFLYREDYYADPGTVDPNVPSMLEVNLAKNRHGSVGQCNMAFSMASSRVTALANRPTKAEEGPKQMTLRKWRQPYGKRTAAGAD